MVFLSQQKKKDKKEEENVWLGITQLLYVQQAKAHHT